MEGVSSERWKVATMKPHNVFALGLTIFLAGAIFGSMFDSATMEHAAIMHNAAIYAPKTGVFTWLNEVKKD